MLMLVMKNMTNNIMYIMQDLHAFLYSLKIVLVILF